MALEKPRCYRNFFLLLCGHPVTVTNVDWCEVWWCDDIQVARSQSCGWNWAGCVAVLSTPHWTVCSLHHPTIIVLNRCCQFLVHVDWCDISVILQHFVCKCCKCCYNSRTGMWTQVRNPWTKFPTDGSRRMFSFHWSLFLCIIIYSYADGDSVGNTVEENLSSFP